MWEFPTFELPAGVRDPRPALARRWRAGLGGGVAVRDELLVHRQVISNRRVTQRVFAVEVDGAAHGATAQWLAPEEIRALGVTMATRRILARLENGSGALIRAAAASPRRARSRPPPP
jgi:hypothetical protein